MTTTDRTAIRRRLSVRRTAHRPPRRGWKTGHGSIVAPLAATVAATVAVGVGVVLAKVERERRLARARRSRDRRFALLSAERTADGCKRIALGQLDLAIEQLQGEGAAPAERAVHETRKALKRLRALMRLLREELGEQAFARENAVLRDAGRRLAGARDAEVILDTLDELLRRSGKLARRPGVRKLRRQLVAEREQAAKLALGDTATRAAVLGELSRTRDRVAGWNLAGPTAKWSLPGPLGIDPAAIYPIGPHSAGADMMEPGLRHIYRQGRGRLRRAARAQKGNKRTGALHQWRKRVKDLRHAAELLGLSQLARRADALGDVLGEEHDLALLAARVNAPRGPLAGGKRARRQTRKALQKLIARRRKHLRKQAFREGQRLYRRSPKRFSQRVRRTIAG
jgi:CHAD domain-containing protein